MRKIDFNILVRFWVWKLFNIQNLITILKILNNGFSFVLLDWVGLPKAPLPPMISDDLIRFYIYQYYL